jgi:tRNA nucleotidyltransferase (CCA-adding enzyme)
LNPPELIDEDALRERVESLPALQRVRDAARGTPAYLVGGAVRDLLLGRERTDLDVVIEGDAAELAEALGGTVAATHERFATAAVELDGLRIDLATARSESYARPGGLPDVRPASIEEDLSRRDFTVNAMAVPLAERAGLLDPHGGRGDLGGGILRVLHDASLVDDPTRAVRAARYAARFGFSLDPATESLVRATDLFTVSEDRLRAELRKLAAEPAARRGFELLDEWGLLSLGPGAAEAIDEVGRLLSGPPWRGLAARDDAVLAAALGPPAAARELAAAKPERPSEAVEFAHGQSAVDLCVARAYGGTWLDEYVGKWRDVRLEIGGEDLMAAGVPEGPAVGRGLDAALRAKLDGMASGRDQELSVALEAARE